MARAYRQGRPEQAEGPRPSLWGLLGFGGRREKTTPAVKGWRVGQPQHTIGDLGLSLSPVASSALGVLGYHLHLGIEGDL